MEWVSEVDYKFKLKEMEAAVKEYIAKNRPLTPDYHNDNVIKDMETMNVLYDPLSPSH